MVLHAPQILTIIGFGLSLGIGLAKNGTPRTGNHNFGLSLFCVVVNATVLWWGGFFG